MRHAHQLSESPDPESAASLSHPPTTGTLDLVVAWYNEDLSWLATTAMPPHTLHIYAKHAGVHPDYSVVPLPNVGRETHTYMHHIVANYDSLADVTIFTQAGIDSPAYKGLKRKKLEHVLHELPACRLRGMVCMAHHEPGLKIPFKPEFQISHWTGTSPDNRAVTDGTDALTPASVRPLAAWYREFVDEDTSKINRLGMSYNSIFAASAEAIRSHPRSLYKRIRDELAVSANPEAGHYVERILLSLFTFGVARRTEPGK